MPDLIEQVEAAVSELDDARSPGDHPWVLRPTSLVRAVFMRVQAASAVSVARVSPRHMELEEFTVVTAGDPHLIPAEEWTLGQYTDLQGLIAKEIVEHFWANSTQRMRAHTDWPGIREYSAWAAGRPMEALLDLIEKEVERGYRYLGLSVYFDWKEGPGSEPYFELRPMFAIEFSQQPEPKEAPHDPPGSHGGESSSDQDPPSDPPAGGRGAGGSGGGDQSDPAPTGGDEADPKPSEDAPEVDWDSEEEEEETEDEYKSPFRLPWGSQKSGDDDDSSGSQIYGGCLPWHRFLIESIVREQRDFLHPADMAMMYGCDQYVMAQHLIWDMGAARFNLSRWTPN